MLQVRMSVVGVDTRGAGETLSRTVILEPVRDASNEGIPESDRVAKGDHVSGRLTLTFDTEQAEQLFGGTLNFLLTLTPEPATGVFSE
jgi:hypothetical protein